MSAGTNKPVLYIVNRSDRRHLAARLGMATRFFEKLDVRFDYDGESVVIECSLGGTKRGHLAIPTYPKGRQPRLWGAAGVWSGPKGVLSSGIAMVGFDLHTCHGAYHWGLGSSLICMDPARLARLNEEHHLDQMLLTMLARELVARHGNAPMLLIGESPHTPVQPGVVSMLVGKLRDFGLKGLIVQWPYVMPPAKYLRQHSREQRARLIVSDVASSNSRISLDPDWLSAHCLSHRSSAAPLPMSMAM